jgi:formylglycine-generating enzyme required for sulfatase activity
MKFSHRVASAALVLAATTMAMDVSLAGKVVDEGAAGIAGVAVVLPGVADTAWTDAAGGFVLTGAQSNAVRTGASPSLALHRTGRRVTLAGFQAGVAYSLDAFLPNGRSLVRGLEVRNGSALLPQGAYQTLFLRVKAGEAVVASVQGVGVSASRSAALVGILEFSKSGYLTDTLAVGSLSASGLAKTMLLSSPWVPANDLVRQDNQVKVLAKGKAFAMGSNIETLDFTFIPEGARHSVKFTRDFWMDTTEVTQKLYDSVMTKVYGEAYVRPQWDAQYGLGDRYPAYSLHTATGVMLFANARSKLAGLDTVYSYTARDGVGGSAVLTDAKADLSKSGYRLPTEAEWEYAARAGTVTDYFWGADSSANQLDKYAVWAGNSFDKGIGAEGFGPHVVASKLPNAYGLYDMQGNLSEWTNDLTNYETYAAEVTTDPTGTQSGDWIIRGGNWGGTGIHMRASNRTQFTPAYEFHFQGARTVRNAD